MNDPTEAPTNVSMGPGMDAPTKPKTGTDADNPSLPHRLLTNRRSTTYEPCARPTVLLQANVSDKGVSTVQCNGLSLAPSLVTTPQRQTYDEC